jgi:DNA modification methylase
VVDPNNFVFNAEAVKRPSARQEKYNDARAAEGGKIWDSVWGFGDNPAIPRLCGTFKEAIPDSPAPQLPQKLLRPIIACASDPGDLVLDPFTGNATTGVGAISLGRRFVGCEKREPIYEIATKAMRAATYDASQVANLEAAV